MEQILSRGLLTGDSYDNMAKQLQKAMQTSAFNANRLITTEAAYFQEFARENTMDALNVERRQIFATLDTKTCEHCGRLDLKVIDKADCTPGVTVPPFHVFCRCTHGPYYDDEFSRQFDKRAYRDPETGKTKTAEMMSYEEWKKKYSPFDITEGGKYERLTISNPEKYAKRIMPEFSAQNFTAKELDQLWQKNGGYIQNPDGYPDINNFLRWLKSKIENPVCRITEKVLNRLTTKNALTQYYIGTRKVDMEYLNNVLGIDTDGLTKEKYRKNAQGKFKKL
ncbi:MAG: minor capsid protein [Eubacteriaceae bacterium]|nr:minor capsid protein [Eubacteriaceae bacterium]